MEHRMQLQDKPFQLIKQKTKTIEVRLHDEKRQQVTGNDIIIFTNIDKPQETLKVKVMETVEFPSFQALFNQYSNIEVGADEDAQLSQKLAAIYQIYNQRYELEHGVLAISIRLIK